MQIKEARHQYISDGNTIKWSHEGKRYCLVIRNDDNADSPRSWDNLAVMACWHRRYNLGDKIDETDPEVFWRHLVRDHCTTEEVVEAIKAGKLGGFRLEPSEGAPGMYDIYETYYIRTVIGRSEPSESLEYEQIPEDQIPDYVLDDLNIEHCQTLLEPYFEWLPLWLYDHSGITMSCGARSGQYADRWDSGQVGWIIAEKEKIMRETVGYVLDEKGQRIKEEHVHQNGTVTWGYKTEPLTEETWRARAIEIMEGEVEDYDTYLRGEVYGYILYELGDDPEEDSEETAEEIDSCWGFYGDDLLENGIPDNCGCGLYEALQSGEYEEGSVSSRSYSYLIF